MIGKLLKLSAFIVALVIMGAAFSAIPNNSDPTTFLGPTARLGVTKAMTDDSAYSVAGEVGLRNLRLGGTIGWEFDYNQRIKASAELLRQKITYAFFDGNYDPWVNQGAVGLAYQYDMRNVEPFNTMFDLSGYYSHAPSSTLGQSSGTYVDSGGITRNYTNVRRLAGSNGVGVSPGITFVTIDGTRAGLELNYDHVTYDTTYRSGLQGTGLGGTVKLSQEITDDVKLGASAAIRKPFNNYQADLSVDNLTYYGTWIVKLFGAYTKGKNTLPNTYNVGIGADYLIDADCHNPVPIARPQPRYKDSKFKDQPVYKDTAVYYEDPQTFDKDFLSWVSVPAVYIPQVLVVPDQCNVPTFNGPIPDEEDDVYIVQLSQYFVGSNLTFAVTHGATSGSATVELTGSQLTITGGNVSSIVVTATNGCGSASSNAFDFTFD